MFVYLIHNIGFYSLFFLAYHIDFDFGEAGVQTVNDIIVVDTKTLLFVTPACPMLPGDENAKVSIIITENNFALNPIDFCYITRESQKSD